MDRLTYKIRHFYSNEEKTEMFGIFINEAETPTYWTFHMKHARLIVTHLMMMDQFLMEKDAGRHEIMKVISIDRREHDGKSDNRYR